MLALHAAAPRCSRPRGPTAPRAATKGGGGETKRFTKVLIANRGEIAVRVIRACKELGLKTVAVYSLSQRRSATAATPCIRCAPRVLGARSLQRCAAADSPLVWQGYGFLSENATFVDICKDHGINFIGPRSEHIRIMGDKSTARDTMKVRLSRSD